MKKKSTIPDDGDAQTTHLPFGVRGYNAEISSLRKRGVNVEVIRTYTEIQAIRDDFVKGKDGFKLPFLIIVGQAGLSKSYMFESLKEAHYTSSILSAYGMYKLAFLNLNKPLIFDDIDNLLKDKPAVSLLKSLCNDRETKSVSWEKRIPEKEGLPNQFFTKSSVCILFNEIPRASHNVIAVLDRARFCIFSPSVHEVHRYVSTWWPKENADILEFIGTSLTKIVRPSIRFYMKARDQKRLGNDWQLFLQNQWRGENHLLLVASEIVNSSLKSGKEMESAWIEKTGKSRASWYLYQSQYLELQRA